MYTQELIDEGAESLLLTKDLMDRALMTRLMLPKEAGVQRPVPYLMDVYSRAAHELRATSRDKASAEQAQDIALNAQDLALSHTFLAITTDMFPQVSLSSATELRYLAKNSFEFTLSGTQSSSWTLYSQTLFEPKRCTTLLLMAPPHINGSWDTMLIMTAPSPLLLCYGSGLRACVPCIECQKVDNLASDMFRSMILESKLLGADVVHANCVRDA